MPEPKPDTRSTRLTMSQLRRLHPGKFAKGDPKGDVAFIGVLMVYEGKVRIARANLTLREPIHFQAGLSAIGELTASHVSTLWDTPGMSWPNPTREGATDLSTIDKIMAYVDEGWEQFKEDIGFADTVADLTAALAQSFNDNIALSRNKGGTQ